MRFRLPRWRTVFIVVALLAVAYFIVDAAADHWLRGVVESRMNRALDGYTAQLAGLDFHPFNLALDLEGLTVRQDAFPDPPVLNFPRFDFSVHWRSLLFGELVADCTIDEPILHVNLVQIRGENLDDVPLEERGWQDALESIYPLKINELRVSNATIVYQDESDFRPLEASAVEIVARNMRNVRSADRVYPSSLDLHGRLFDAGRVEIHGNADFLAKPAPAYRASIDLEQVDLGYFEPVLARYTLSVRQGFLTGFGRFETGPNVEIVDLERVVITDAVVDYVHGAVPPQEIEKVARTIEASARSVMNAPETLYRIQSLSIENGTIGFVNEMTDPPYRFYAEGADFELRNLSSRAEDGLAEASLHGTLMGTGEVNAFATFYPEGQSANFAARLEIAETQLAPLNDMLRAHANLDVVAGVFGLYTEVRVQDGLIDGWIKPLFRDVNVYDPRQDKHKNVFRKMYEGIAGGLANLLENNKRDEVATVVSISGPVSDPHASTLQIIGNLLQNAFFKAILPGFDGNMKHVGSDRKAERRERRQKKDDRG